MVASWGPLIKLGSGYASALRGILLFFVFHSAESLRTADITCSNTFVWVAFQWASLVFTVSTSTNPADVVFLPFYSVAQYEGSTESLTTTIIAYKSIPMR